MRLQELRIGNRIGYLIDNCAFEVNELRKETLVLQGVECKYLDCKPIPLTEDWLIKIPELKDYIKFNDGKSYYEVWAEPNGTLLIPCPFIHTAQNIHHALTGEELTISK